MAKCALSPLNEQPTLPCSGPAQGRAGPDEQRALGPGRPVTPAASATQGLAFPAIGGGEEGRVKHRTVLPGGFLLTQQGFSRLLRCSQQTRILGKRESQEVLGPTLSIRGNPGVARATQQPLAPLWRE